MHNITIDFNNPGLPQVIDVMQSDAQSRFIGITLYDGGVPYSAPSGAQYTVQYRGSGANNMGWYDTIQLSSGTRKAVVVSSSSSNVVTLELAEQALRVNGKVEVSLCVVNNTGYKLNTFPIICRVTGAPYVDPVAVRSYFYVTGLTSEQWLAYVTACQDAQKRAEDAAAKFVIDDTLTQEGQAADAKATGKAAHEIRGDLENSFSEIKNLCIEVEIGKVYNGWGGVGTGATKAEGEDYFCAKIEIPDGATYISTTIPIDMAPFSFFVDEKLNIISDVISHLGDNYVYSVPPNAKYLCGTYSKSSITERGIVAFSTRKIIKNKYSVSDFPYGKLIYIADDLKYSDGTKSDKIKNEIIPIYVKKDGSGDFTSLVEAIEEAEKSMNRKVFVGKGEWDIISELGNDYIESVSSSKRGIYLKNGIHLIFSSQAVVKCKYTGNNKNTIEWLSAFNSGPHGFTLENCRIESENCRYSVHDERDSDSDQYKNVYKNCIFTHTKQGGYDQCIGGGLGLDGHIIIDGCKFLCVEGDKTTQTVSYHNSGDGYWDDSESQGAQSVVEIANSYFSGTIAAMTFGKSKKDTEFLIHGNSVGSKIIEPLEDNPVVKVTKWNNEVRN